MAKAKTEGGVKRVQNRHCYSRMAFLHQAAQHLASKQFEATPGIEVAESIAVHRNAGKQTLSVEMTLPDAEGILTSTDSVSQTPALCPADRFGLSRRLASHILTVSRKVSVRASREIKRSICKRCSSVLVPGQTTDNRVENKSRGGHKPHADVMVVTCSACGFEKRYPFGAQKQTRKKDRVVASENVVKDDTRDPDHGDG